MSYTAEDIKIAHPFVYDQNGLEIPFDYKGQRQRHVLSDEALMESLFKTGIVLSFNKSIGEVKKPTGNWVRVAHFVEHTLNDEIASELILHYLNNKPAKP